MVHLPKEGLLYFSSFGSGDDRDYLRHHVQSFPEESHSPTLARIMCVTGCDLCDSETSVVVACGPLPLSPKVNHIFILLVPSGDLGLCEGS